MYLNKLILGKTLNGRLYFDYNEHLYTCDGENMVKKGTGNLLNSQAYILKSSLASEIMIFKQYENSIIVEFLNQTFNLKKVSNEGLILRCNGQEYTINQVVNPKPARRLSF